MANAKLEATAKKCKTPYPITLQALQGTHAQHHQGDEKARSHFGKNDGVVEVSASKS